jgi:taurine transport system permease protein
MGLSNWFRGWFDPIVEFMRPVPPLALIPLIIIWFGIGEDGQDHPAVPGRALDHDDCRPRRRFRGSDIQGPRGLFAGRLQVADPQLHVIVPNSLPEIFTGARVAMGVCWGTVVAAELVAADRGAGMMIVNASKFQLTDIVILGIILIGIIGYGIDILMRMAEKWLVPWKGRG